MFFQFSLTYNSMEKFEYIVLNAKRVKETSGIFKGFVKTEFYNQDGTLKATIPAESKQPRKGKKFYTLNCFKFRLNWN